MKKFALVVLAAMLVAGCNRFESEPANVVAYNASDDPVEFYVNDGQGHHVGPNRTDKFTQMIQVATKAVGTTGPSTVDRVVQVSISVKNLRTGKLMPHRMCTAGAKVITHISYEVSEYGYEYLDCDTTYPGQLGELEKRMKQKMGLIEK